MLWLVQQQKVYTVSVIPCDCGKPKSGVPKNGVLYKNVFEVTSYALRCQMNKHLHYVVIAKMVEFLTHYNLVGLFP